MAANFRIHRFMKAIRNRKGNITHHSRYRFNILPIRISSSSSYFSNYHSKSFCEYPDFDDLDIFDDYRLTTRVSFTIIGCCFKLGMVRSDVSLYNMILDGLIFQDRTHEAERWFKKLFIYNNNDDDKSPYPQLLPCEPDIVTYNTMLKGLCKVGNSFTAIALLRLMDRRGCKPDIVSYTTVIDGLCYDPGVVNTIDDALKLFNEMFFIKGVRPDADMYYSLIYALCKLGRWVDVCKMLKRIEVDDENIELDLQIFNIIIDALCKQNKLKEARGVFVFMRENGYHPNIDTFNSFIQMFCYRGRMSEALETLSLLRTKKIKPNIVTYNTLIDGCMKDLNEELAIKMSQEMPEIDKVTHYLLSGLLIHKTNHHHYQSKPEYRDAIKCSYLYHLYMHGDSIDRALELFNFMGEHELNSNIEVYNILIFGAKNCGRYDVVRKLFHELTVKGLHPDEVTYSLIIIGFFVEGLVKDAERMFVEMKQRGFLPDDVIDMMEVPLCYLEEPYFFLTACISRDMYGIWYRDSPPPVYVTLLALNLPELFFQPQYRLIQARAKQYEPFGNCESDLT